MRTKTGTYIGSVFVATLVWSLWETPLFSAENENPGVALPERLESRRKVYEEAIETAQKPVKGRYRRDLELMIDGYTRARDLDSSLAVSKELKTLDGAEEASGEAKIETLKLVKLREDYFKEMQRVQAPISERYSQTPLIGKVSRENRNSRRPSPVNASNRRGGRQFSNPTAFPSLQ